MKQKNEVGIDRYQNERKTYQVKLFLVITPQLYDDIAKTGRMAKIQQTAVRMKVRIKSLITISLFFGADVVQELSSCLELQMIQDLWCLFLFLYIYLSIYPHICIHL